jgi:hypothetical protein
MMVIRYCLLLLVFTTPSAMAQFELDGFGSVVLSTGRTEHFDFGFSYFRQEGEYRFIVGRQSINVPSVPKKFSLVLILQNDEYVWVPDFINQPITGFDFHMQQHKIQLFKDEASHARGKYILQVNNEKFQFSRGPGQINFYFTEQGIKEIRVEGMFKPRR